ncbi:MAG: hypothetical protein HY707_10965 [Ignavibacteriae bacterium]|nr:hypothetical protein [Ignavibacteriota bacterium]
MEETAIESESGNELTERRHIYSGDPLYRPVDFASRVNRPVKRRKQSPFILIALLFGISMLIVFYIWNKIAVNRLVVEVNDLKVQHQKIMNANEVLRAEINRKSSLERIGKIAGELGLKYPKEQPNWLEVDLERLQQLQQQKQ